MAVLATFESSVGDSSVISLRRNLKHAGRSQLNKSQMRCTFSSPRAALGSVFVQEASNGFQPSWCGSKYTMPHLQHTSYLFSAQYRFSRIKFLRTIHVVNQDCRGRSFHIKHDYSLFSLLLEVGWPFEKVNQVSRKNTLSSNLLIASWCVKWSNNENDGQ